MKLKNWKKGHNYTMFLICGVYLIFPKVILVIIASFLSIAMLWIYAWREIYHLKPAGGWPNWVTLFRFLLLITVTYLNKQITNDIFVILISFVVVLDGLDGFLARKLDQRTDFGALFDMETDSVFVCIVSCLLLEKRILGTWILIPAFIKYFYFVFTDITGMNKLPEPRTFFGATIAVVMFIGLILAWVLPENIRMIPPLVGTILICISFLYSFYRQILQIWIKH
jgi:phosphatidylglycerophosphate synthase